MQYTKEDNKLVETGTIPVRRAHTIEQLQRRVDSDLRYEAQATAKRVASEALLEEAVRLDVKTQAEVRAESVENVELGGRSATKAVVN